MREIRHPCLSSRWRERRVRASLVMDRPIRKIAILRQLCRETASHLAAWFSAAVDQKLFKCSIGKSKAQLLKYCCSVAEKHGIIICATYREQSERKKFVEHLRNIKGMEKLIRDLPKEYRYLPFFGNILKFVCERVFDYEKWENFYNINLLTSDEDESYKIQFLLKNVHGDISFKISEPLSGFAICDMKECGHEQNCQFRVYDYEDRRFSIYCEDIEAALLKN